MSDEGSASSFLGFGPKNGGLVVSPVVRSGPAVLTKNVFRSGLSPEFFGASVRIPRSRPVPDGSFPFMMRLFPLPAPHRIRFSPSFARFSSRFRNALRCAPAKTRVFSCLLRGSGGFCYEIRNPAGLDPGPGKVGRSAALILGRRTLGGPAPELPAGTPCISGRSPGRESR